MVTSISNVMEPNYIILFPNESDYTTTTLLLAIG